MADATFVSEDALTKYHDAFQTGAFRNRTCFFHSYTTGEKCRSGVFQQNNDLGHFLCSLERASHIGELDTILWYFLPGLTCWQHRYLPLNEAVDRCKMLLLVALKPKDLSIASNQACSSGPDQNTGHPRRLLPKTSPSSTLAVNGETALPAIPTFFAPTTTEAPPVFSASGFIFHPATTPSNTVMPETPSKISPLSLTVASPVQISTSLAPAQPAPRTKLPRPMSQTFSRMPPSTHLSTILRPQGHPRPHRSAPSIFTHSHRPRHRHRLSDSTHTQLRRVINVVDETLMNMSFHPISYNSGVLSRSHNRPPKRLEFDPLRSEVKVGLLGIPDV